MKRPRVRVLDRHRYDARRLFDRFDSTSTCAVAFGVDVRTIQRWALSGFDWIQADELCARLDLHPGAIWPEWWDAEFDDDGEQLALALPTVGAA